MTTISNYNSELVFPAARFSTRVPFGTGPAMIKGSFGDWESYPIYPHSFFDIIKETYDIIPQLFFKDIETEFINFLKIQYKTNDLWGSLRKNFKTLLQFTHAFHEKVDGLRILQFLKKKYKLQATNDEHDELKEIQEFITSFLRPHTTHNVPITELSIIRDELFEKEMKLRNPSSV
jgi:hypothetical protein